MADWKTIVLTGKLESLVSNNLLMLVCYFHVCCLPCCSRIFLKALAFLCYCRVLLCVFQLQKTKLQGRCRAECYGEDSHITCMVATTMIHNIALLMIPHQHDKHMLLYSIQPRRHFPTPDSIMEGAALMLMHHLHAVSSLTEVVTSSGSCFQWDNNTTLSTLSLIHI